MKSIPYLFAIMVLSGIHQSVCAQRPGGVKGALSWSAVVSDGAGRNCWTDRLTGQIFNTNDRARSGNSINFNPVWQLGRETPGFTLPLPARPLPQLHIFSVQQVVAQTGETHLWSLEQNDRTECVMTDRRVADLSQFRYMNFAPPAISHPVLSTYRQHESVTDQPITRQSIRLGGRPKREALPVLPFQGLLAELILFDRQLSPKEQSLVESYLAIKYGLTLQDPEPTNYLRSDGLPVWHGRNLPDFHHAVAGIGRDDASGLDQSPSSSSLEPGLLTIGWTRTDEQKKAVPDGTFLMWGHNDQSLTMDRHIPGQMEMLERQWHIQSTTQRDPQTTTLSFERKSIRTQLKPGEQFWLIVDRSGTGTFPQEQVAYYSSSKSDLKRIYFEGIPWDTDGSGNDRFTLGKGPALFAPYWLAAPSCSPPSSGTLTVAVAGGIPTYSVALHRQSDGKRQRPVIRDGSWAFDDLTTGDYTLSVRDARDNVYQTELYIESSDSPQPLLANNYYLPPAQSLTLDASIDGQDQSVQYSWTGPDQFQSREAVVKLSQPGPYQVEISRGGCISRRLITVETDAKPQLERLELFPNPTSGRFNLTFELHRAAPSTISVYNAPGQLINQFQQDAGRVHYYSEELQRTGIYFLKIKTGSTTQTLRLVVE